VANNPLTPQEAVVWNFLIFWCHGSSGARLTEITEWLADHLPEAEVYIAIASLTSKSAVDRVGELYFPMVNGEPYQSTDKDWGDPLELTIDPLRVLH
jgi:hypothetical protein